MIFLVCVRVGIYAICYLIENRILNEEVVIHVENCICDWLFEVLGLTDVLTLTHTHTCILICENWDCESDENWCTHYKGKLNDIEGVYKDQ